MSAPSKAVGILGGTGAQGKGLAIRLAAAGEAVIIGSRSIERGEHTAREVGHGAIGATNRDCASRSDVIIIAVPWEGHAELLRSLRPELAGKLIVDCVNPLGFDSHGAYPIRPKEGSAAEQAAWLLPKSRVTAAFHHLPAGPMADPAIAAIPMDVLVLGDDRDDTRTVQTLAERIPGIRGVYGGRLRNAHQVEALVANLISINRRYRTHAGLRVTGVEGLCRCCSVGSVVDLAAGRRSVPAGCRRSTTFTGLLERPLQQTGEHRWLVGSAHWCGPPAGPIAGRSSAARGGALARLAGELWLNWR